MAYHTPVMLKECIDGLNIIPSGVYVDATFGGGGHSSEILKHLKTGKLIAIDCDTDALNNKIEDKKIIYVSNNFRNLKEILDDLKINEIDGIIADLGVSSYQIDDVEKGFTTRQDSVIDLRLDKNIKHNGIYILNSYSAEQLKKIFYEYGEIKNSSKVVNLIIIARKKEVIKTSKQLIEILKSCVIDKKENKFFAQVFQALRIEVNDEMNALKDLLMQCPDVLKQGGRLVVLSYHSLEDRIVKNIIKYNNFEGEYKKDFYGNNIVSFKSITKKPLTASEFELKENNRSRSAKLRIAEKI